MFCQIFRELATQPKSDPHGCKPHPTPRVSPCRSLRRIRAVHPLVALRLPGRHPRQADA